MQVVRNVNLYACVSLARIARERERARECDRERERERVCEREERKREGETRKFKKVLQGHVKDQDFEKVMGDLRIM